MNVIVDIQGFKTEENEFIPKEIAIMWNGHVFVLLIKPPIAFYNLTKKERLQVSWIEKNRGIYWNEGYIPYNNYKTIIVNFFKDKCIFVKGSEKVLWLKNLLNTSDVYNLEDKKCPSLVTLNNSYSNSSDILSCIFHRNVCALKNVTCLNKWCIENNIFFK